MPKKKGINRCKSCIWCYDRRYDGLVGNAYFSRYLFCHHKRQSISRDKLGCIFHIKDRQIDSPTIRRIVYSNMSLEDRLKPWKGIKKCKTKS